MFDLPIGVTLTVNGARAGKPLRYGTIFREIFGYGEL
jgi:hypothetical protein